MGGHRLRPIYLAARYWAEADRIVGDAPSTLRLTLPEVYLEDDDVADRTARIHETMRRYIADGTLRTLPAGVILTERWSGGACPRRGIVLAVDLEAYEYTPGSASLIRPTEKTVVERIPPRLKVRQGACMELPHIMILIDDPDRGSSSRCLTKPTALKRCMDTDLMQGGGTSTAGLSRRARRPTRSRPVWSPCATAKPSTKSTAARMRRRCFLRGGRRQPLDGDRQGVLGGDQKGLSADEQADHPARFALVEVVNITTTA